MKGYRSIVWTLPLLLGIGCVERTLTLTSDPPGALVYLNGEEVGRTPLTRDFVWYGNYDVALRKDGYETVKTTTNVKPPVWQWIPLDFAAELLPVRLRDAQSFSYSMMPASTQPVNAEGIIYRAHQYEGQLESGKQPTTQPATRP